MLSNARSGAFNTAAIALATLTYPLLRLKHQLVSRLIAARTQQRPQMQEAGVQAEMSMNDPQWGKRPNKNENGPPDFDEIVRKFNQKLGNLFGNKGNNNGTQNTPNGGGGGPSKAMMGGGFIFSIGLAVAVWLASGFYIVETGRKGIELRLGKYKQTTVRA